MTLLADVNVNWYLLPALAAFVLVYSATRFESWGLIFRHALLWFIYLGLFMGGIYLVFAMVAARVAVYWYIPVFIAAAYFFFWSGKRPEEEQKRG